MKREDDIMASYLLKGGKMLAKSCPACGCPLFEYRGETLCVVCRGEEEGELQASTPVPAPEERAGRPAGMGGPGVSDLASTLEETLAGLCVRIREEKSAGDVSVLMGALKTGAEALRLLR